MSSTKPKSSVRSKRSTKRLSARRRRSRSRGLPRRCRPLACDARLDGFDDNHAMTYERTQRRAADALRPVQIERGYTRHAEGSVLVCFGDTKVLCTASVDDKVPPHKRGSGEGWV